MTAQPSMQAQDRAPGDGYEPVMDGRQDEAGGSGLPSLIAPIGEYRGIATAGGGDSKSRIYRITELRRGVHA